LTHFSTALSNYCSLKYIAKKSSRSSLVVAIAITFGSVLANSVPAAENTAEAATVSANAALNQLPTKGRAPKTGYSRELFSDGWGSIGQCDLRNYVLKRDLKNITWRDSPACTVSSGTLKDPYTGKTINFVRGVSTSLAVQIDHVVAVSDAWQKGAQQLSPQARYSFYNDPLNLLAVDGPTNSQKGDSDAASWLPPNKAFRCHYVARQITVKRKYRLWVTSAEKAAMQSVLSSCPSQKLFSK
jgi:hypothetical protein